MSGDGWIAGTDGIARWGVYGAAGLLLRHTDHHGITRYFLAERGPYVHHPGTWAYPGGALHHGETVEEGARREATEEFGTLPPYVVAEVVVDRPVCAGGWFYATVVADVGDEATLEPVTHENTSGRWFSAEEMNRRPLHPGIAVPPWPSGDR